MADYRLSAQVISRSSGQSAIAAAAYRAGERLHDARLGEAHDYTRKSGVLHTEIMAPANTPAWMHDRAQLWNAVEAAEKRKDAQLAREIQLSLPHELDHEGRIELARRFVQEQFVERGMIADLAIHAPGREGDDRNHHAHVMLTMRELTGEGFGKKAREWNGADMLDGWREQWANHQNREFEKRALDVRVDHRSYEAQGIDREPTQHLGPTASKMERRGQKSRIGDENRRRESANDNRRSREGEARQLDHEIAREKQRFEAWAHHKREELKAAQQLAKLDLARQQDHQKARTETALKNTYGTQKAGLEQAAKRLDERQQETGLRSWLRKLTGKTRAEREERAAIEHSLVSIQQRQAEQRQALEAKQQRELRLEEERQGKRAVQLERGIDKARARREAEGWKPREPQPGREGTQGGSEGRRAIAGRDDGKAPQRGATPPETPKVEKDWLKAAIRQQPGKAAEQENERPWSRDFKRAAGDEGRPPERRHPWQGGRGPERSRD